jgi:hypothetical protein
MSNSRNFSFCFYIAYGMCKCDPLCFLYASNPWGAGRQFASELGKGRESFLKTIKLITCAYRRLTMPDELEPGKLEEKDWNLLLGRIKDGKCNPFLGAGACAGVLPRGSDIAKKWAEEYEYPLEDCADLARVAQFMTD